MEKTIISEGKTTNEAIENGLKKLNVSKDRVDIKVLENEDKRSFFSILAPRVVKVEMTLKENFKKEEIERKIKEIELSKDEQQKAKENVEKFLEDFIKGLPEGTTYNIKTSSQYIYVDIVNKDLGYLIGYRGETLYSLQNILSAIAGKGIENKVRVILDIAKTVIRTKKSVKLEPMQAYERKIIHSKLQKNPKVETSSVGEEPYRRVIVSLKK